MNRARGLAVLTLLILVTTLSAGTASAAGGPFGLGIIIGSPTGLSGKLYLNRKNAIDFALGAAFLNRHGLGAHVDYLWHPVMLANDDAFYLPLYFGIGGRILNHDRTRQDDDVRLGVRVPAGILFDFKRVPIDVFIEIALVLDFINDGDNILDLNAGIGVRYYF